MDWVGPVTTAGVAFAVGAYLDVIARRRGSIDAPTVRRILIVGAGALIVVVPVVAKLTE